MHKNKDIFNKIASHLIVDDNKSKDKDNYYVDILAMDKFERVYDTMFRNDKDNKKIKSRSTEIQHKESFKNSKIIVKLSNKSRKNLVIKNFLSGKIKIE